MPISAGAYQLDPAFEGQIASLQSYTFIKGTQDEVTNSSNALIPFGRFVVAKPSGEAGEIQLPSADGQTFLGVTTIQDVWEKNADGTSGIPSKYPAHYLVKGIVWVRAEVAMSRGDAVFVRYAMKGTPGAYDAIGRIRDDVDDVSSTEHADAISNVRLLDDVAAGGLARLELDLSPLL